MSTCLRKFRIAYTHTDICSCLVSSIVSSGLSIRWGLGPKEGSKDLRESSSNSIRSMIFSPYLNVRFCNQRGINNSALHTQLRTTYSGREKDGKIRRKWSSPSNSPQAPSQTRPTTLLPCLSPSSASLDVSPLFPDRAGAFGSDSTCTSRSRQSQKSTAAQGCACALPLKARVRL